MSLLALIVLVPLIAALGLLAVPRQLRVVHRAGPVLATGLTAVLGILLFWRFDAAAAGYQFVTVLPVLGSNALGIQARLGVDGLNVGLLLMGAVVAFAAACSAWEIQEREKEFGILLLVMTGGILGAFASLDLFFFYFFHELALVPTFIMVGVWGRGEQRNYATFKMTLYLSVGALIALAGLIALYVLSDAHSFDLERLAMRLQQAPLSAPAQNMLFGLLLFGFGILVSLFPFHTWAPLGYSAAPTPTAMLHAGVLKKFGLYGLIRVGLPLLPEGASTWMGWLIALALGNLLYVGLVAMRQRNLNGLIGHSSVAHMGFAFLGIASLSLVGVTGAVVVMVAHGFLAALSFGLSGYLHHHAPTLEMAELGGLARRLPFVATALTMALLAGCGLPGFANFIGEVLVLFGAWKALPLAAVLACWGGLILGGVYMIRAIRVCLHGPLPERWAALPDANAWRRLPAVLLLAGLLLFGAVPSLLVDRVQPAVAAVLEQASRHVPEAAVVSAPAAPPSLTAARP